MLGITGLHCAGKETVERYVAEKRGYAQSIDVSAFLREGATELGLSHGLYDLLKAYRELGSEYFFRRISEAIDGNRTLVSSLRDLRLCNMLRFRYGLKLIHVSADPEIRFERLQRRRRSGDLFDYAAFLEFERQEAEFYDIDRTFESADFIVNNNGSLSNLYRQLDALPL